MIGSPQLSKLEELIALDQKFLFTLTSYVLIAAVYINLNLFGSPALGIAVSVLYFLINAIFLGRAFFGKEDIFFRLTLGILSLIILLGFVGWAVLIIYNLDVVRITLVLFIVATFSSLLNKRMRQKNAT